jgi:hypothetical protein
MMIEPPTLARSSFASSSFETRKFSPITKTQVKATVTHREEMKGHVIAPPSDREQTPQFYRTRTRKNDEHFMLSPLKVLALIQYS